MLAELLQNALEHGLTSGGTVSVDATRHADTQSQREHLRVVVTDDGCGLPEGFVLENSKSLGLQIVRALVQTELDGTIELHPRGGGGVAAVVDVPLPTPRR